MKSYRLPNNDLLLRQQVIVCSQNTAEGEREKTEKKREEKRKEAGECFCVSQSRKTKNLSMSHAGGGKNSEKSRQPVRGIKSTQLN